MENNERDRKLDQWLDDALSEYSAAEPRFGLEQRVINRVRAEQQVRARRWNLWHWMPAFGAIAAIVVVAVAIRPVMEKKVQQTDTSSGANTYYSAQQQNTKTTGETARHPEPAPQDVPKKMAETRHSHSTDRILRQELALSPAPAGRDEFAHTTEKQNQPVGPSDLKKAPIPEKQTVAEAVDSRPGAAAPQVAPPPPPPPPTAESLDSVGRLGDDRMRMSIEPAQSKTDEQLQRNAGIVQAEIPAIENEKLRPSTVLLERDARRKEAHAKTERDHEEANGMDVFGVRVSFETGPTTATHQFPTPMPLSQQEKLAIAAGHQLKEDGVAHKAGDKATDIEIKPIEIKPLEGPEK